MFEEVFRPLHGFCGTITSSYPCIDLLIAIAVSSAKAPQDVENFYAEHTGLVAITTLLVTALGVVFTAIALFRQATKREVSDARGALARLVRSQLLDYVERHASVADELRQAIRIDLNLTHTPDAVPVELRLVEETDCVRTERSTDDTIGQIFNRTGGRLLILGDPGTGKTNLLHELARHLVTEARNDPEYPVPILLNLARWTLGARIRTLTEWIIDDLHDLYGLTMSDAAALIHNDAIIPLLDGLDEVDEMQRVRCVEAINAYQDVRSLGRFAVCCRWEEYSQLIGIDPGNSFTVSPIKVRSAIRVDRLSSSDIERELSRPGLDRVREILESDPDLRSFVDTPLWLHILFLGALATPLSFGAETPRDRLYANYVSHILARRPETGHQKRTDASKLLRSLGWLAAEMKARHQTQFVLEALDWSWVRRTSNTKSVVVSQLPTATKKKRVRSAQRVTFGIGVGLVGAAAGGWIFAILVGVLAAFRIELRIEAAERLKFDWKRAISRWHFGLAYGSMFAVVFGWRHGLLAAGYLWLFAAIFEMFQGGFQPRSGDGGVAPNHATSRSLRYALAVSLAGGLLASMVIAAAELAADSHLIGTAARSSITDGARWIAFAAFILGGEKGGWFVIRHHVVRAALWWQRVIPGAYVHFLNESVERLFLIRRGGTYEFIHSTFLDYMAARHDPRNPRALESNRQTRNTTRYPRGTNMVLVRFPVCKVARSEAI